MANDNANPWREAAERGFEDPREEHGEGQENKKSPLGCLLWGCLIVVLLAVVAMITTLVGGYYFLKGQIEEYTDAEPIELPVIERSAEDLAALEKRVEAFEARVNADPSEEDEAEGVEAAEEPPADDTDPLELSLTADDLNALIASNPDLKGRVFLTIEDGLISGKVSIPTDALPMAGGRYFNATATFDVRYADGDLTVQLVEATVKDRPLPQAFLDAIAKEDLAEEFERDPEVKPILQRIESLRVEGDRIVLTAIAAEDENDPEVEPEAATEGQPASAAP